MLTGKRIILTKHCIERFKSFGIARIPEMVEIVKNGELQELDKGMNDYKRGKYGESKQYRNGEYVFPVLEQNCKFTGKPIYLVITVYNQKLDLPAEAL